MTSEPLPVALDESSFQSVLCVAAHPDDLEYGAAAAVDKWVRAGKTVTYLLATRGEAGIDTMSPDQAGPAREQEERNGALAVGVEVVDFLDGFTDGTVEYGLSLRRALARQIRIRRPDRPSRSSAATTPHRPTSSTSPATSRRPWRRSRRMSST